MIYVIYGEERLLMDRKKEELIKESGIIERDLNVSEYDCTKTPLNQILDDAYTLPFLSDKKIVILNHPYFLTSKKEKVLFENDDSLFMNYLKQDPPETIMIIFQEGKDFDERKKLVKELRKKATFFEIEKLNHHRLAALVRSNMKRKGATIDDDALELFLSRVDNDLIQISQEVEKCCLYTHHVTCEVIEKLVARPIEENAFLLSTALLNQDRKALIQIYQDLMVNHEEPIKLIVLMANQIRLIYQVKLLDRKGYTDKEIAAYLSVNPFRLRYLRQEGKNYDLNMLLEKLDQLSKLDIDIKQGKIDKYLGLELFLMKV